MDAARLFTSGFEIPTVDLTGAEWSAALASPTLISTNPAPHSGSRSVQISASGAGKNVRRDLSASVSSGTYFFRFYINYASVTTSGSVIAFTESSGGVNSNEVRIFDTGGNKRFRLSNVPTAANADCSNNLSSGTWYRVEERWIVSDTVGEVQMQTFTGDSLTADCSAQIGTTNTDTLGTNFARFYVGTETTDQYNANMDDVGINDSTGSFQTSWLGPGKIVLLSPLTDNSATWTKTGANCSGSTDGADCVDDISAGCQACGLDNDSGYMSVAASAATDRFNSFLATGLAANADMILVHVIGVIGGTSTQSTNTARLDLWDKNGTLQAGPTVAWCDRVGYPNGATILPNWLLVYDAGNDTRDQVESYSLGYQSVSLAQTCKATALWANVEYKDVLGCTTYQALLGVGCK